MSDGPVEAERVRVLSGGGATTGRYVLYWMQQSQRAEENPALEHAVHRANERGLPVVVGFGLMDDYPEANRRHYRFMLEGLVEVEERLGERGIPFVIRRGHPAEVALELSRDAALLVCDRGYLRHQRKWRARVAEEAGRRVEEIEGDVVVPVEAVSGKREYAARTIRPKIHRHLGRFLAPLEPVPPAHPASRSDLAVPGDGEARAVDLSDLDGVLEELGVDPSVPPVTPFFRGGTSEGKAALKRFLGEGIGEYREHRNQPRTDDTSRLSPYLHFGQVSPVWAALEAKWTRGANAEDTDSFLEELIVRRELAMNFVNFEPRYDSFAMLPDWAKKTLARHREDPREPEYSLAELERAETHDPYWNAAQREMLYTGYMHNYMRMYWGKQIIAWSPTPEQAFERALYLNNRYFLDGRDAASYTNVGWLFGLHDRAWQEREVFGKVRILTKGGLERKTDPEAYVEKVDRLVARAEAEGIRLHG